MSGQANLEARVLIRPDAAIGKELSIPRLSESKPYLYIFVFGAWVMSLFWFHPRLAMLLDIADGAFQYVALGFFILFTELAWLYAFYNVGVVIYATFYRYFSSEKYLMDLELPFEPAVALLYATCNDFNLRSAISCLNQDYSNFTLYLLDDSSDEKYKQQVDEFASRYPEEVRVIRRANRKGFKAGNLNNALSHAAVTEPFFAIADADEVLPRDFLLRSMRRILTDDRCGFVQANHQSNPEAPSSLAASLGPGIDAHWRWYHPLRNRYGFVMLLGHGALIRRKAWEDINRFPEIVSEDLAFALRIREHGWRGHFAEDIICYEDFPETIRAFRVRHMKWTRGTCEFLWKEMGRVIRSRRISLVEKFDVIFPTINLPLSLFYFLYLIDANLILTTFFSRPQPITFMLAGYEFVVPAFSLHPGFNVVLGWDFYLITFMTLVAPIMCFVIEMYRKPLQLLKFLGKSTALYGTLGPLSCLGVVMYVLTGKAVFHVTAESGQSNLQAAGDKALGFLRKVKTSVSNLLAGSHPDSKIVQGFEVTCGVIFGIACLQLMQISFFGLSLGFVMLPLMHYFSWDNRVIRKAIYIPFSLLIAGLVLGGLSLFGVQTALFGYGFHF